MPTSDVIKLLVTCDNVVKYYIAQSYYVCDSTLTAALCEFDV